MLQMTLMGVAGFQRLPLDVTNACEQEALSPDTEAGLAACHIIAILQTSHANNAFAGTRLKLK